MVLCMSDIQQQEGLFRFQLDILLKEIDLIDHAIGRLDEMLLRNRNWGTTLWAGMIAIILPIILVQANEYAQFALLATVILPVLFWLIDIRWKMALLQCSDRQKAISCFLNCSLEESFNAGKVSSITLLDPTGEGPSRKDKREDKKRGKREDRGYFVKAILYKDTPLFYPVQILVSLLLFIFLCVTQTSSL